MLSIEGKEREISRGLGNGASPRSLVAVCEGTGMQGPMLVLSPSASASAMRNKASSRTIGWAHSDRK